MIPVLKTVVLVFSGVLILESFPPILISKGPPRLAFKPPRIKSKGSSPGKQIAKMSLFLILVSIFTDKMMPSNGGPNIFFIHTLFMPNCWQIVIKKLC